MSIETINTKSPAERFHENMGDLCDFIYDLVDRTYKAGYREIDPQMITMASNVLSSYEDKKTIIEKFIKGSHGYWNNLLEKDETFMIKNAMVLFSFLPNKYVQMFQNIFTVKDPQGNFIVDEIDRLTIWTFIHSFVKISICHIHECQEPYVDGTQFKYRKKFEATNDLNFMHHVRSWKIQLNFPKTLKK